MDVMWSMSDMPAVNAFIKTLPARDRQDCLALVEIAVQETLEQEGRMQDYEAAAINLIASVSSR